MHPRADVIDRVSASLLNSDCFDENDNYYSTSVLGVAFPFRNQRGHFSWHGFVKRIVVFWCNGPPDFA